MDMASHTMGGMTATPTMDMSSATESAMDHDMGGMGMGDGCKISMLFNLNTIDACFLSDKWRITSQGMFAGSCIGVFLLGMMLELLRRSIKEYDRFLIKQHVAKFRSASSSTAAGEGSVSSKDGVATNAACTPIPALRPTVIQQAIRAFLHLLTFVCGYILMLLAMYYNGYIILCIFLGAFFGAFVFQWEPLTVTGQPTSAAYETTVCCG